MSKSTYAQEFNKQLAQQLHHFRVAQPNHIPVYSMKYKNASKYLIEDLKQPLALFPKKFKLQTIYEMIENQSILFCQDKLKDDKKIKDQGDKFKISNFYLYTISIQKNQPEEDTNGQKQDENNVKQKLEDKKQTQGQRPIGKFIRLDLQMTYGQAYEKYGRENVLTIVYTDATDIRRIYQKASPTIIQKWLTRLIILILILVLIPYLMRSDQHNFESSDLKLKLSNHSQNQRPSLPQSHKRISPKDTLPDLQINEKFIEPEQPHFKTQTAFYYKQEDI